MLSEQIKEVYSIEQCLEDHGTTVSSDRIPCPIHGGKNDSFAIHGDKWSCHSNQCGKNSDVINLYALLNSIDDTEAIKQLSESKLVTEVKQEKDVWEKECAYTHTTWDNATGQWVKVIQSVRYKNLNTLAKRDKSFRQSCPDGSKPSDVQVIPFYEYDKWCNDSKIVCVEGHKDVDTLMGLEIMATCNIAGAGNFKKHDWTQLKDKDITIFFDNDKPGIEHAIGWYDNLKDIAKAITIVKLPTNTISKTNTTEDKKDVTDYVEQLQAKGKNKEEIVKDIQWHAIHSTTTIGELHELVNTTASDCVKVEDDTPVDLFAEKDLVPVDKFTPSLVPSVIADWVMDEAERMSVTPDFLVVGLLSQLSLITADKLCIKVKENDNWIESPALWGALIGEPSTKKSPALSASMSFTKKLEQIEAERFDTDYNSYNEELTHFSYRKKAMEKVIEQSWVSSAKAPNAQEREAAVGFAKELARELVDEEPIAPIERCYTLTDGTYQAITEVQASGSNPLVLVDEVTGLLETLDDPRNAQGRAHFLAAYNGKDSFKSLTIGRGKTNVERNMLGILGGIQPDKLRSFILKAKGNNDGLLARLSLAVYPDPLKDIYIDRKPDAQAKANLQAVFNRLDNLDTTDFDDCGDLKCIRYSPEAQVLFEQWYNNRPQSIGGLIDSYIQKFPALVSRLSLVFHICESDSKLVSIEALQKAIDFSIYLLSHAKRIYGMKLDPVDQTARRIAKGIIDGDLPVDGRDTFGKRDVKRKCWGGIDDSSLDKGLSSLVEDKWLICTNIGRNLQYEVNPKYTDNI